MKKSDKKLQDEFFQDLDKTLQMSEDFQDVFKDVRIEPISKKKQFSIAWLTPIVGLSTAALLFAFLPFFQNKEQPEIGGAEITSNSSISVPGQQIAADSTPNMGENIQVGASSFESETLNLLIENMKQNGHNIENSSAASEPEPSYTIGFVLDQYLQNPYGIYETTFAPYAKDSHMYACYVEHSLIEKMIQDHEDITCGDDFMIHRGDVVQSYYYNQKYQKDYEAFWLQYDKITPIESMPLQIGKFSLVGLFYFEEATIHKEVLTNTIYDQTYLYYQNVSLFIDYEKSTLLEVKIEDENRTNWYIGFPSMKEKMGQNSFTFFNQFYNHTPRLKPLCSIKDGYVVIDINEDEDFIEHACSSCPYQKETYYYYFEYEPFCTLLYEYAKEIL